MPTLRIAIAATWLIFWAYWLVAAFGAKASVRSRRRFGTGGVTVLGLVILLRVLRGNGVAVHSLVLGAIGAALVAAGLAIAVWARIVLGRNWGMPMTERREPELITAGPYRVVRHPIYSGLILALLGTALATSLFGLILAAVVGGYFCWAATIEERNLAARFPTAYPGYRDSTKMLIPFVL